MMNTSVTDILGELNLRKRGGSKNEYLAKARPPKGARRFAILRVAKIKGLGKLAAAAQHNLRERNTHNADPDALSQNRVLVGDGSARDVSQRWHDLAPDKIRTNAVHALEYVVTASPEAMTAMGHQASATYLEDALDWLKARHGADNILSAVVHEDETTSHLQVLVIPLDARGKLNARDFVGGAEKLRMLQTDFAAQVGAEHGLERGVEGSVATHKTIKEHYSQITAVGNISLETPERAVGGFMGRGRETDEAWRQRASLSASEALRGATATTLDQMNEVEREARQAAKLYEKAAEQLKLAEMTQRGAHRALDYLLVLTKAEYLQDAAEARQIYCDVATKVCGDRTLPANANALINERFEAMAEYFGTNLLEERRAEIALDDDYSL